MNSDIWQKIAAKQKNTLNGLSAYLHSYTLSLFLKGISIYGHFARIGACLWCHKLQKDPNESDSSTALEEQRQLLRYCVNVHNGYLTWNIIYDKKELKINILQGIIHWWQEVVTL